MAPWWRRRPHRSLTSLGQWSWRTETEVDLDYHVRLSALPPRADRRADGRWFLNYTPACWTAPARYGRWT
ncbi:wax ester/triacylglycerol synthase domain-containing protein [Mycobacterium tuberculosis]